MKPRTELSLYPMPSQSEAIISRHAEHALPTDEVRLDLQKGGEGLLSLEEVRAREDALFAAAASRGPEELSTPHSIIERIGQAIARARRHAAGIRNRDDLDLAA